MKIQTFHKAGFTLVEIMIVVAIIGLLASIAIPNFIRARMKSQHDACINNLRQIDAAKQQWAMENNQLPAAVPGPLAIAPYVGRGVGGTLVNVAGGQVPNQINCPASGTYTINQVDQKPTCNAPVVPGHALPN